MPAPSDDLQPLRALLDEVRSYALDHRTQLYGDTTRPQARIQGWGSNLIGQAQEGPQRERVAAAVSVLVMDLWRYHLKSQGEPPRSPGLESDRRRVVDQIGSLCMELTGETLGAADLDELLS